MGGKLLRAWARMLEGLGFLTGLLIIVIMLLITASVVLRYAVSSPIEGSEEISGYIMLYATFLGAAWLLRRDGHVRVSFLLDVMSERARVFTDCVTTFLSFLMSLLLFQQSFVSAVDYFQRGSVSFYSVLRMPIHLLYWPIAFGSFLLCIESALQVIKYLVLINDRRASKRGGPTWNGG